MKKLIFLPGLFFLMLFQINTQAQIFHEDFEIADSVTYSSNGAPGWAQNDRLSTSGDFCDSAFIQNPGDIITMTTLPFSTIGMDSVFLYFNHISKIEFFDGSTIEVSSDGGITWTQLIYSNPSMGTNNCLYYGLSLFASQGCKFAEASYATWQPGVATLPEYNWWKREIFDISQLLANTANAQIRFVLQDQNNTGGAGRAGWFIDDIMVRDSLDLNLYTFLNRVEGKIYVDYNSNQIQDFTEPPINYQRIAEVNTNNFAFVYIDGHYQLLTFSTGVVEVQPNSSLLNHPYFNLVPSIHSTNFLGIGKVDSLNDFALQPTLSVNDISIDLNGYSSCFSQQSAGYTISYYNKGTTIITPSIVYYPDLRYTLNNSTQIPSYVSTDSIIWTPGPIEPFQRGYIRFFMWAASPLSLGDTIISSAKILPLSGDTNINDNFSYDTTNVCLSFDPNIINVNASTLTPNDISASTILEYTIYFQNTGNTAASYVRVDNLITQKLDLGTLEILAYSHNVELNYNYFVNPRLISFTFNNINLPDSTTNEPESHGFVKYRIKPNSNLVVGDSILNNAAIYFDLNPPVLTNTAVTEIIDPTSIEEMTLHNNWIVYPNPVNSELNINFELLQEEIVTIEIFNLYGQKINVLLEEKVATGLHQHKFNIESLSNGVYLIQFLAGDSRQVRKFVKVD